MLITPLLQARDMRCRAARDTRAPGEAQRDIATERECAYGMASYALLMMRRAMAMQRAIDAIYSGDGAFRHYAGYYFRR